MNDSGFRQALASVLVHASGGGSEGEPMHPSNKVTEENLETIFTFQNVPGRTARYENVRFAAKQLARVILKAAPDCADRSAALRLVRESVMVANAAIALAEPGTLEGDEVLP
jgi:hypothetical protein